MPEEAKNPHLNGSNGSAYDVYIPMGMTAENVAQRCNVTREQQDEWAVISQNRAVDARDSGHFDPEIVPVPVPAHKDTDKDGNEIDVPDTVVTKDDGPRAGTTMEVLGKLKPAFRPDGTVTAGNACPLNDGAAAVLVMSAEKAKQLGLTPKARIIGSTVAAIRPEIMGLGPIPAIQALLEGRPASTSTTSTWSRSTRRSRRRSSPARRSSGFPTRSSTRSVARSRSVTRSG